LANNVKNALRFRTVTKRPLKTPTGDRFSGKKKKVRQVAVLAAAGAQSALADDFKGADLGEPRSVAGSVESTPRAIYPAASGIAM
jgi:hypothetical protein